MTWKKDLLFKSIFALTIMGFYACKTGTVNLFKAASPHEQYQKKLTQSGLDHTFMGTAWIESANASLQKALTINIPYRETGYFASENVRALAYKFSVIKGQKLTITLNKKPTNVSLYLDVWSLNETEELKKIASADTLNNPLVVDVDDTGNYLIRLQPELLQSIEYTLSITTGPSLAFPTQTKNRSSIQSYWGDSRDANARRHEGVDIFGKFRSPVLASANGTVTRVNENNLGGKVVWLRPTGKDFSLYYAHLDEQVATEGQIVKTGDTVGLMGNTGNAKTTPTHLHFGIYETQGAVNPLPFIDPITKTPAEITASTTNLNKMLRTQTALKLLSSAAENAPPLGTIDRATIVKINAATRKYYLVELPNGTSGFLPSAVLVSVGNPIRKTRIAATQQKLYDKPHPSAASKLVLKTGEMVNILGNFENFQLVSNQDAEVGWIVKQ